MKNGFKMKRSVLRLLSVFGVSAVMSGVSNASLVLTGFTESQTAFSATYAFTADLSPDIETTVGSWWSAEVNQEYIPDPGGGPATFSLTWTGLHLGGPHFGEIAGTNVIGSCTFSAATLDGVVCDQSQSAPHLLSLEGHRDSYDFYLELVSGGGTVTFSGSHGAVVPIPAAIWLFGSGMVGLVSMAKRRRAIRC